MFLNEHKIVYRKNMFERKLNCFDEVSFLNGNSTFENVFRSPI